MDEGNTSLDSILSDEPITEPVETPEVEAEATPEPEAEQPRGPDGKFLPKQTGVEPEETPEAVPPTDKLPKEDYKAIRDEREKRQRLEAELEALRQQVQSQQAQTPPAPPPSIWEDEQGWQQHFGQQVAQQAALNAKLDMSEMLTRQNNPDFEEVKARFIEMAQANPAIVQQAMADPHPWAKAYSIAKNAAKMEELGAVDLNDLKAKLREEVMAELQQASVPVQQPLAVPPSLTGERNVGARTGPAWAGPKSLNELLG